MAAKYENPSVNSVRMQRASRINQVEKGRLFNRLTCLEQEKVRRLRLVNQEVRMVNLMMEFIQSSSGRSQEGMAPDDVVEEEEEDEALPCFMYGERTNSRRFGKNDRRVHSAITFRRGSGESSRSSTSSTGSRRPRSGPAGMRTSLYLTTGNSDIESAHSDLEDDPEDGRGSGSGSRARSMWMTSDAGFSAPMILTARRRSSARRESSLSGDSRTNSRLNSRLSKTRGLESHRLDGIQGFSSVSSVIGRFSRIPAHAANTDRLGGSSGKAQPPKPSSKAAIGLSVHRKQVMEFKKEVNQERNQAVGGRLQAFMSRMPVRRY